jgi:hypothetical protein
LYIVYIQEAERACPPAAPRLYILGGSLIRRSPHRPKKKRTRRSVEDEDTSKSAKERYGRRWRSRVKAQQRERYIQRSKKHIEITDFTDKEKDLVKASLLAMGSVQVRYNTCGKRDCPCMTEGRKHGPYYYLSLPLPMKMVKAGYPRMKHFYVTKDEALVLEKRIKMFKKLQDAVWDEIWDEFNHSSDGD